MVSTMPDHSEKENDVFRADETGSEWTIIPITMPSDTATLNSDMSSHRRTLSKQGSISGRRKPSRAAMHSFRMASTEDSIFVDSTDAQASNTATLSSDMSSHRRTLSKQGSISGRRKPSRAAMHSFRMASTEDSIFVDSTDAQASDTATLSSDMSSHRRTLSKQGSISGRRKPSRAAMRSFRMTSSEDSIFVDSTEPRPPSPLIADETEESHQEITRKRGAGDISDENSCPPAKIIGDAPIPGLLEGLMGSKLFNKRRNAPTENINNPEPTVNVSSNVASSTPSRPNGTEGVDTEEPYRPASALPSESDALSRAFPAHPGDHPEESIHETIGGTASLEKGDDRLRSAEINQTSKQREPEPLEAGDTPMQDADMTSEDHQNTCQVSSTTVSPESGSGSKETEPKPPQMIDTEVLATEIIEQNYSEQQNISPPTVSTKTETDSEHSESRSINADSTASEISDSLNKDHKQEQETSSTTTLTATEDTPVQTELLAGPEVRHRKMDTSPGLKSEVAPDDNRVSRPEVNRRGQMTRTSESVSPPSEDNQQVLPEGDRSPWILLFTAIFVVYAIILLFQLQN